MFRTALLFFATAVACSCTTNSNNTLPAIDRAQPFNAISARQFGLDAADAAKIRREMQRAVDVGHISGALLWVGNGSGIGLLESLGTQTQDSATPVTTDTIFRIYSMTKPIRFSYFQDCIDWRGGEKREGRMETELAWKVSIDEVKERDFNLDIKNPNTVEAELEDPETLLAKLQEAEAETAALQDKLKSILSEALAR